MIKTGPFIAAAVLALAVGVAPATAGTRLNAITSNGISVNALTNNGTRLNAITSNGTRLNALTNNGTRLNAITANGAAVTGLAAVVEPIAIVPAIASVRLSGGTTITLR